MIREFVLQLKRGSHQPQYFREKYGVDVLRRFAEPLASHQGRRLLEALSDRRIALTRDGLLRVDVLLHGFFLPQHTGIRYT